MSLIYVRRTFILAFYWKSFYGRRRCWTDVFGICLLGGMHLHLKKGHSTFFITSDRKEGPTAAGIGNLFTHVTQQPKNVDAPVFVTATKSWDALKPAWPALHKIKISACHSWSRLASHHLPCLSLEASAPTPTEQFPVTGTAARNPSHAKHVNLQNHPHQYLPHGTCQPI